MKSDPYIPKPNHPIWETLNVFDAAFTPIILTPEKPMSVIPASAKLKHYLDTHEDLSGAPVPVLDDGWVLYIDHMGSDLEIAEAARVTSQKEAKKPEDDRHLIRYLMRHRHTTPFEMCELKICVRVPMDCWRQWIRHRTANVNEYSTRYTEAIDSCAKTDPDKWRLQAKTNRQGSSGDHVSEWPEDDKMPPLMKEFYQRLRDKNMLGDHPAGGYLSDAEQRLQAYARQVYEERLAFGVAKEQARKDLPLSNYTEAYWKIDLHNLLHFLSLRLDAHAQYEIRMYAEAIADIVRTIWPLTWEAFRDYHLQAMTLTHLDIRVIQALVKHDCVNGGQLSPPELRESFIREISTAIPPGREREECIKKLARLDIPDPWIHAAYTSSSSSEKPACPSVTDNSGESLPPNRTP